MYPTWDVVLHKAKADEQRLFLQLQNTCCFSGSSYSVYNNILQSTVFCQRLFIWNCRKDSAHCEHFLQCHTDLDIISAQSIVDSILSHLFCIGHSLLRCILPCITSTCSVLMLLVPFCCIWFVHLVYIPTSLVCVIILLWWQWWWWWWQWWWWWWALIWSVFSKKWYPWPYLVCMTAWLYPSGLSLKIVPPWSFTSKGLLTAVKKLCPNITCTVTSYYGIHKYKTTAVLVSVESHAISTSETRHEKKLNNQT